MAISSALGGTVGAVPIGSVTAFAGSAAPSGWLLCGGQTVSRTQFSGLFLTIGTTYGSGDGSTTFALPDLRGRTIAGEDDMGGTAANRLTSGGAGINGIVLGATGGSQTHTLDISQIPSVASASHRHEFGFALNDNYYQPTGTNAAMAASAGAYRYSTGTYQGATLSGTVTDTRKDGAGTVSSGSSQRFSTFGDTQTPSATAGGGGAHNNTQPTIVLNYIIKAA
jgi:microcystin-dependent protein